MKIKFTKASKTDKTLVTLNLAQFDGTEYDFVRGAMNYGDVVTVSIEGQEVVFYINRFRNGKASTAVSHCYPRFLRLPQVGRPVHAEVDQVS